ncbi:GNAT family N-acetyltransferase [Actibacterium sp. 188UL27-1]|uniref:GNAT family N-acetyltransferase n=1 Tax=Actibacterium sp. 188UL27-1 TaxID=2786961 RepID=UPI00195B9CEC|nr:GNAT family N-acetyltransferase [Actibacterium sp. 188UL27-1]MBM7066251.1 GNAT family N-acetyltransferase [Actibacterium sp. 188UL27-1]
MQPCLIPPTGPAAVAARAHRAALPRLKTRRLILRAPVLEDFTVWEALFLNGDFDGGSEAAWEEFCVYTAGWLLRGSGLMALEHRETGETLGFVLLAMEWEDLEPELGWMLAETARGQGYATEAAVALRDHGFGVLGQGRFVSYIDATNSASRQVAERLGAACEGTAPGEPDTLVYRHGVAR